MDTNATHATDIDANDIERADIESADWNHNNGIHQRWLWFTEVAGQLAEIEVCDNAACSECAVATPVGILEETQAA